MQSMVSRKTLRSLSDVYAKLVHYVKHLWTLLMSINYIFSIVAMMVGVVCVILCMYIHTYIHTLRPQDINSLIHDSLTML